MAGNHVFTPANRQTSTGREPIYDLFLFIWSTYESIDVAHKESDDFVSVAQIVQQICCCQWCIKVVNKVHYRYYWFVSFENLDANERKKNMKHQLRTC